MIIEKKKSCESIRFYTNDKGDVIWIYTDTARYFISCKMCMTAGDDEHYSCHTIISYQQAMQIVRDNNITLELYVLKLISTMINDIEQIL